MKKFVKGSYTLPFAKADAALPFVYVTGGSAGSHGMNQLIEKSLPLLLEKYRVLHQTGDAKEFEDFQRLTDKIKTLPAAQQKRYEVQKFMEPQSVGSILSAADVVVSRSGINTVTELMAVGTPALFIPLPTGQKNEQLQNAQFAQKIGMAEIISQTDATPASLLEHLDKIVHNKSYKECAASASKQLIPNAAQALYDVITYVSKKTPS
jgi:UDP-N-acetylglucosamine--N-acetylmuramyl-(pentapeptide) pyrophosphoryl-undecaprenol N-acetylglucosamine transferase